MSETQMEYVYADDVWNHIKSFIFAPGPWHSGYYSIKAPKDWDDGAGLKITYFSDARLKINTKSDQNKIRLEAVCPTNTYGEEFIKILLPKFLSGYFRGFKSRSGDCKLSRNSAGQIIAHFKFVTHNIHVQEDNYYFRMYFRNGTFNGDILRDMEIRLSKFQRIRLNFNHRMEDFYWMGVPIDTNRISNPFNNL